MNILFAMEYIPRRMCELEFGQNYVMRYQHIRLENSEIILLNVDNDLLLLISPETGIRIESSTGVFEINDPAVKQQQHEHTGTVKIINRNKFFIHAVFIQVTPLNNKKQRP
ncbi:MAG: hypothetical protein MUC87_20865 [Bacteroidia bacterium]|jgi:hypothetical protein|nr:hypothetical protein [Bacteroidia bacterium]